MIPQNSSEIYPIEMRVSPNSREIVSDSYSAKIVVDGEVFPMKKRGNFDFAYDYRRPRDSHKAKYYYELNYENRSSGRHKTKTVKSPLYELVIINRYVVGFENNRGLPGSTTHVLGRGFCLGDRVEIVEKRREMK